jgi:peptidoglycan/LPS O-acetylase OafA/YrhL
VNYLPLSCGDSLGVGALLAFASRGEQFSGLSLPDLARMLGIAGLIGGMLTVGLMFLHGKVFWLGSLGHTFLVLVFGWLVFGAAKGFGGPLGWLLDSAALRFLGRISYGLYVFHHFFTGLDVRRFFDSLGLPAAWADYIGVQVLCRFTLTLLLAATSWYLYEKPLNNLKRHFTLRKKILDARAAKSVERLPNAPISN